MKITEKQIVQGNIPEGYTLRSRSRVDQTAECMPWWANRVEHLTRQMRGGGSEYRTAQLRGGSAEPLGRRSSVKIVDDASAVGADKIAKALRQAPQWLRDLSVWQGPWDAGHILDPGRPSGTGAGIPDGVPCGHPGCLSHVSHPCEGCGRIAGHSQSEAHMTRFGFRWVSLGRLTEVQSLFPTEEGFPEGAPSTPFLAGISRMRRGDAWNQHIGIAVAMVRFRDNGHYNTHERKLSNWLRHEASDHLPTNAWGDFFLSLGQLLEVLRIRSEFRIALAVDVQRIKAADKCLGCILARPSPDQPIERAIIAVRNAVEGTTERPYPQLSFGSMPSEAAIAESCAKRILKVTGPLAQIKPR
jgi:hypothetical protein